MVDYGTKTTVDVDLMKGTFLYLINGHSDITAQTNAVPQGIIKKKDCYMNKD